MAYDEPWRNPVERDWNNFFEGYDPSGGMYGGGMTPEMERAQQAFAQRKPGQTWASIKDTFKFNAPNSGSAIAGVAATGVGGTTTYPGLPGTTTSPTSPSIAAGGFSPAQSPNDMYGVGAPAGNGNGWDKIDGKWVLVGGGTGTGTGPGTGTPSPFNPLVQGQQVDEYMRRALANDPRMPGINQNISGRIAPDVIRQLQQGAAERGVGIGSYGGGNDASGYLRSLGLTSMDLTNKGIGQYGDAYSSVPKVNVGDLFESESARQAREQAQRMQTERLKSEAELQQARLNQDQGQFNVNRGDTLSNNARINQGMDAMIARLGGLGGGGGGGGNAWGGTNYTPAVGGGGGGGGTWPGMGTTNTVNNFDPYEPLPGYYGENEDWYAPAGWENPLSNQDYLTPNDLSYDPLGDF